MALCKIYLRLLVCPEPPIHITYTCIEADSGSGACKTQICMHEALDRQDGVLLYCYVVTKTLGFDWLKNHRGVDLVMSEQK